jgi:hypothetical protein
VLLGNDEITDTDGREREQEMDTAVFTPDASEDFRDSNGVHVRSVGGSVEIVRKISPDEIDGDEVGDMYEVRNLINGLVTHAFADELKF